MNKKLQFRLFLRSFFLQTSWNYMKYQNIGLAFVMWPFLKQLYKNDSQALPAVMKRYLDNFNTQPVMASFCFGVLAKEEERLKNTPLNSERYKYALAEWNAIKQNLSITTASIGDRLFWGSLKPLTLLLALFIWLSLDVNFLEVDNLPQTVPPVYVFGGIIAAFLAFNIIALFVKWKGISLGYYAAENACFGLTRFDWNKTIYYAKRCGVLLTAFMLFFAGYYFLKDFHSVPDVHFIARAAVIVCFVLLSFVTRKLRVPNMYLYLSAIIIFNIVCLF